MLAELPKLAAGRPGIFGNHKLGLVLRHVGGRI